MAKSTDGDGEVQVIDQEKMCKVIEQEQKEEKEEKCKTTTDDKSRIIMFYFVETPQMIYSPKLFSGIFLESRFCCDF